MRSIYLWSFKLISLIVFELWPRLKFRDTQTDRQTHPGQKLYAPRSSIWGHKKKTFISHEYAWPFDPKWRHCLFQSDVAIGWHDVIWPMECDVSNSRRYSWLPTWLWRHKRNAFNNFVSKIQRKQINKYECLLQKMWDKNVNIRNESYFLDVHAKWMQGVDLAN